MFVRRYWLLLIPLALLFSQSAHAVTRVPLVINEAFADRAVPWPVTTGVPFPRDILKKAEKCRLVDDQGREWPVQTKVAATWDAQKTSIRWLTIDFIAKPGRKYFLVDDSPAEVNEIREGRFYEDKWAATLRMPPVSGIFHKTKSAAVRGILGERGGGVGGPTTGEHFIVDSEGNHYTSAGDGSDRVVEIETKGPVRSCVRVAGYYTGPRGERIAKYQTRYHLFDGLPIVKIIDELQFIQSTKGKQFKDIGFTFDIGPTTLNRQVVIDSSGVPGNQPHRVAWKPDTQSVSSYQQTYRHYGNPECVGEVNIANSTGSEKLVTNEHVGEWIQITDDRTSVVGSLRWFWQQFPKEWEVKDHSLTLHYWSPRAGELDFGKEGIEKFFGPAGEKYLRAGRENHNRNPLDHAFYHADLGAIERGEADGLGINKHHEFWLVLTEAKDATLAQDYARHAAVQPLCLASGEWNCSTDVFGPLAPRPNDSKYEAAVDKIFDLGRQGQDDFGDYGWWLFGAGPHYSYHTDEKTGKLYADSRRFEFHTYGKETQLWWNYLRSGERKFHDWAIPSENHWCDIAVSHQPTKIHCDWLGGVEQKNRTLHWRPGEWSIDNPTHYVRTHDRAEAWLRGGAQFWASYHRTLETTSLAHYITGDPRYNDVINYWRDYWKDLAGKTNRSKDIQPWHQEQAWYQTFKDAEREMTWAEMIRDYAPFSSGSRHQHTLFFNLATLYEHTWDPQIKQVLDEYAAAFLDPKHAIGVWRSQDNSLPAHAEAPAMAHFWVPALWKYERVTRDQRMKEIFQKYFDTAYAADPFREFEDVGVYSNTYCAYAYYFTRDPRYLTLAKHELDQLLPNSLPLKTPQEINQRLYNPYAPAKTFTAVPRLLWALQEAAKEEKKPGPAPLRMQRTTISLHKTKGQELTARLWGFEPKLSIKFSVHQKDEDPQPYLEAKVTTREYHSEIQPFDRILPNYECYLHQLTIPAAAPEGRYLLEPKLELAVLETNSAERVCWNAANSVALKAGEYVIWWGDGIGQPLRLITAQPHAWQVTNKDKIALKPTIKGNLVEFPVDNADDLQIELSPTAKVPQAWFKIDGRPLQQSWVHSSQPVTERCLPVIEAGFGSHIEQPLLRLHVPGRFGRGVPVLHGNALHIPDHVVVDGNKQRLFDEKQGTIEFWIRRSYDERLTAAKPLTLLTNGLFIVTHQPTLPLGEWAHIALVWAPYHGQGTLTYLYVNGRDAANYRSLNWPGYSGPKPSTGTKNAKWLEEFVAQAGPDSGFEIDELRISKTARYADLAVKYGPQQTFNPVRFSPPEKAFEADEQTTLLMHFDGDLKSAVPGEKVAGTFSDK